MKCQNCNGDIPAEYRGNTCPACGEILLRETPTLIEWTKRVAAFTEDRGFWFWLIAFSLITTLTGTLEHLFSTGIVAELFDQHKFIGLLTLAYSAMLMKLIRNANSVVRPGYPGRYWTDRLIIKNFKRGTNGALVLGFMVSLVAVGPFNLLTLLPAYVLIISTFVALYWSIAAFRVDDREYLDAKVNSYFEYLGVRRLREWRKASGAYLIGIIVATAIFFSLLNIPGLWWAIKKDPTLNGFIDAVNGLFNWVPQILPNK